MTTESLSQFKDQHGRIVYRNKYGEVCTWFGYIREVNSDHIIFQDNEKPHKFKINNANIEDFTPMKVPDWRKETY